MTTVAYHHCDRQVAVDGRVTAGNFILTDEGDKTVKIGDRLFVFCGALADYPRFASECVNGKASDWQTDVAALMIMRGRCYLCTLEDGRYIVSELEHNDAIGSGAAYAVAAMDFGQTARQAIRYAASRNCKTGGKIKTFKV